VQPEFATALASAYNDWQLDKWLKKDDRLLGSIAVAAQDPISAASEIERLGAHRQYVQVQLPASSRDVLARSFYHPIYEAAEKYGLVIAFHQSGLTTPAVGTPPYYVEWHTTIPQAWQSQLAGLIFHGVFEKYPKLRVVMVEGGWTWLPSFIWRADYNYMSCRREVPWLQRKPSEYVRNSVYLTTQPMDYVDSPEAIHTMYQLIGRENALLFSSDYPHWDFDAPLRALPPTLSASARQAIMYENAMNVYSLDPINSADAVL
jgi:predicted TIM-barrel fold metal-dependent hydrolase